MHMKKKKKKEGDGHTFHHQGKRSHITLYFLNYLYSSIEVARRNSLNYT
jgi:hypothetical protein